MPSHLHLAYRRNAKAAIQKHKIRKNKDEDLLERAREDFGFFCEYVADKPPAKHHKEWHKQLVTNEDSNCLVKISGPNIDLLGPRGSAKSTVLGLFTAWAIGVHTTAKKPLQILYLSYTVDIARSKSATIKRIIDSKKYQNVFPSVRLLKNVTSNEYWSIDHKFAGIDTTGEEQFTLCAAGLKGSVTSKRSHLCLTGDTLVHTNRGPVSIHDIYESPGDFQVRTFNPRTGFLEWSGIRGVSRRLTDRFIHLATSSGDILRATPEHPFYIPGRGIIAAQNLQAGDNLIEISNCFQNSDTSCLPRVSEKIHGKFKLAANFIKKQSQNVLVLKKMRRQSKTNIDLENMSRVHDRVQARELLASVLLKRMCCKSAFQEDERKNKFKLEARQFQAKEAGSAPSCTGTRQYAMRSMWYEESNVDCKTTREPEFFGCSSYRCQSEEQRTYEFNHLVQAMPYRLSSISGKGQSAGVAIASVSETCGDQEYVYDLETESENHNFFAGKSGYCVSNCIIDDPVKSSADISNPDIRKTMQDNWNAVISPTMFEGGRAICLGTRFRHDDIHATTFCPQNNWMQIVLSAIQNNEETGEEESYWPGMWSLEYLKEKKRQAPIAFSFQYMNQIVRQNELSLAPELLVKAEIATEFDTLGVGVDLSAGTKEKNDYTVFVLGGRIGDKIHIIDYRRMRAMGNLEKLDALKELLYDWSVIGKDANDNYFPTFSTCDIYSEAVAYQASLEADFKRICLNNENLYNLVWHAVKGFRADKLARFRGVMGLFEDRKVIFNRYRNFTVLFEEMTNFGVSSHDDTVDALVWLINGLMKRGKLQVDY